MRAVTLYEPWAALVAAGWKEVETRSWYTSYRGPLAIHSSVHPPDKMDISRFTFLLGGWGFEMPEFHQGCVVAVCWLVACISTELVGINSPKLKPPFSPRRGWTVELQMGNYDHGRWAWVLRDVQRLETPVRVRGKRNLWDWTPPADVLLAPVSTDRPIFGPALKAGV
jgi:activating signal cointegrator 1